MTALSRASWWILFLTTLLIIATWPPDRDRSLLLKLTNWAADPQDSLPILPAQLGYGVSDDLAAVEARDTIVRRYDRLYADGGLMRLRLRLKVARDPFAASTSRQFLLVMGAVIAFVTLRPRAVGRTPSGQSL